MTDTADGSPNKPSEQRGFISYISCYYSPKPWIYFFLAWGIIFIFFEMQALDTPFTVSPLSPPSWCFSQQWKKIFKNNFVNGQLKAMTTKLRESVTFLPLKDLRYSDTASQSHTWFMSSMYDTQEEGGVQFLHFPSEASKGRLLCLMGRDIYDGSMNSYALAYPEALPQNATLLKGLSFVSYSYYDYNNIWHGLSALIPFVAWHKRTGICAKPSRWILYHRGELRKKMATWLAELIEATFLGALDIETFEGINGPACFEEAVVMRHDGEGMSRDRGLEVYDMLRCKARLFCNVSLEGTRPPVIGMTMLMRTGGRSFRNGSEVIKIFKRECEKVEGCEITVAYSNDLSFCEQVSLMSTTDILVSPHGAQLTNMFLMDRNSSVMEFFPKGWLKLAGVGQYVFHWIADSSGMRHQGVWRDPTGEACQYPEDDHRCFSVYKSGLIGYNETYFANWGWNVLNQTKIQKNVLEKDGNRTERSSDCTCVAN